ncbi:hypothetical protein Tsubulata_017393 [Turnera subulata]|uniref:Uncharacterized protein n=1 Tax=Turnera subulata TaxID=218843 RepID=A0A9Q0FWQ8_9ROSI|nr:hypothetical protein Tsubulata_017393 [Turnera subulata]
MACSAVEAALETITTVSATLQLRNGGYFPSQSCIMVLKLPLLLNLQCLIELISAVTPLDDDLPTPNLRSLHISDLTP